METCHILGTKPRIISEDTLTLPHEYEKCLVGLNSIVREAWTTSQQTRDRREKIRALSLAKDCYAMKLELLTNATIVDDAIRFVAFNSSNTNFGNIHSTHIHIHNRQEHEQEEEGGGVIVIKPETETKPNTNASPLVSTDKTVTFKDLRKKLNHYQPAEETKQRTQFFDRLDSKPFWIWDISQHKQADIVSKGDCWFNYIIGLPKKNDIVRPMFDYEVIIFDCLTQQYDNRTTQIPPRPNICG